MRRLEGVYSMIQKLFLEICILIYRLIKYVTKGILFIITIPFQLLGLVKMQPEGKEKSEKQQAKEREKLLKKIQNEQKKIQSETLKNQKRQAKLEAKRIKEQEKIKAEENRQRILLQKEKRSA